VLSVRRRRQGCGKMCCRLSVTGQGACETGGQFRQQSGRPLRNSEGPHRNLRYCCTGLHNRTTELYSQVTIETLVYGDCRGL